MKNAEISQCTQEVPIGLQHENTAPDRFAIHSVVNNVIVFSLYRYFHSLVNKFEQQMALYQSQIEELEGHLSTMAVHEGVAPQSNQYY